MDYIKTIKVYIEEKNSDYAIMLNGNWGAGKTYFIKNVLVNQLKIDYPLNFIYISLFNMSCMEDVYATIDYNMFNIKATNAAYESLHKAKENNSLYDNVARASTIKSLLSKGATCLTAMINIPAGTAVNEAVNKVLNESYKDNNILSYSNDVVFVFDDFERTVIPKAVLLGLLYNGDGYYLSKNSHLVGITSVDLTAKIKLLDNEQLSSLRNLILNFYVDARDNASKYYKDFKIIKDVYEEIGFWLQTDKNLDLMKRFHVFKLCDALKKAKEVLKSQQEVENNNVQGGPIV